MNVMSPLWCMFVFCDISLRFWQWVWWINGESIPEVRNSCISSVHYWFLIGLLTMEEELQEMSHLGYVWLMDGLVQDSSNSSVSAMELLQSCTESLMCTYMLWDYIFNTLRPRQNGRHFADDISKCIFLNENVWIPIEISLKFVSKVPIDNILALVQIMAWRRPGDKPLSEPMMVRLPSHICVTRPQWVN